MVKEELYDEPTVFAIPYNRPFVVANDKVEEFLKVKPNLELIKKREELIKKLNIKDKTKPINDKGLVLKKIIK